MTNRKPCAQCLFKSINFLLFNLLFVQSAAAYLFASPPLPQPSPLVSQSKPLIYSPPPSSRQPVDCELNLNGRLQFDACGVCGGDNSTCNPADQTSGVQIEHVWRYADYGECIPDCNQDEVRSDIENGAADENASSSFTVGFQTSHPLCFRRVRGRNHNRHHHLSEQIVGPDHCDQDLKPSTQIRSCENFVYHCRPRWLTNDWANCSVTCGIGHQKREIYCGLVSRLTKPDGSPEQILRVDALQCAGHARPSVQRQCEEFACSNWFTGPWTECSTSCGQGVQNREVTCRNKDGELSVNCRLNLKPTEQQLCTRECDSMEEFGLKDQPDVGWQKPNKEPVSEEPAWVAGEWSGCSADCGQGMRQRTVECKMLFKFSGTVATLPDDQCHHESRPESKQPCFTRPCDEENEIDQETPELPKFSLKTKSPEIGRQSSSTKANSLHEESSGIIASPSEPQHSTTLLDGSINEISNRNDDNVHSSSFNEFLSPYQWIIAGFTDCSSPCLGGTQDSIIQCVHRSNGSEAAGSHCDLSIRPDYVTRTCNDKPCPPRWNVSEYGPCSRECGKGIQTRQINCIHEVTRDEENVIQLPNSNCSYPPPTTQQFCNIQDCESRWVVGEWSACKQRCGKKGKRIRTVKCFKLLAYGEDVEVPEVHCKDKRRPKFKKRCVSDICIPPKAKLFPQNKSTIPAKDLPKEQSNKYSIDNSLGFKRTHIDFKKLEDDQRKWKEIKNFINSESAPEPTRKNQTASNWKTIIESNSIDTTSAASNNSPSHSTSRWHPRANSKNGLHKNGYRNGQNGNHNANNQNSMNNYINNHLNKRTFEGMSTSSAAEPHSSVMVQLHHLQKLLTKLLTRKSTKKLKSQKAFTVFNRTEEFGRDESIDNQIETNEIEDENEDDERLANNIVDKLLLTDTGIKSLVFDWMVSGWSSCSVGFGTGFQIRGLQCMVKLGNTTKAVNEAMCLNAGLRKPSTIKRCGGTEWKVAEWAPCKFCIRQNTGIQTRVVQCVQQDSGEAVSSRLCDSPSKPEHRRECVNPCDPFDEQALTLSPLLNEEEVDEERVDDKL